MTFPCCSHCDTWRVTSPQAHFFFTPHTWPCETCQTPEPTETGDPTP